jgi:ribosome-binding protein aMBF1 (putative translation factor)
LADVSAEDRLDVDNWRPIDRLEVTNADAATVDGGDPHPVQTDGIRAVRRRDRYLGGTVSPRLDTMIRTLREAKGLSQVELARLRSRS